MSASKSPLIMGNISLSQGTTVPEMIYLSENDGEEFKIRYFTIKRLIKNGMLKCDTIKEFMDMVEAK